MAGVRSEVSVDRSVQERVDARVGTSLRQKYRLDRVLGVGSCGAVYEATHRNGMRVAVKVLHPEIATASDARSRFLREGYIANRIEHAGVVRILDDDEDEETTFLVMELLEGSTLADEWRAAGHRLGRARAVAIGAELLDVLVAAARANVVHRDLKPDNVFVVGPDRRLKVLDFGIARLLDQPRATPTGDALGAAEFVAPELARGRARDADARADVYAVGAMLFAFLTGRFVHDGKNPLERMIVTATTPAPAVRRFAPDLDEDLAHVVDVALSFDRELRWPSAAAMRAALMEMRPG
ncbi:MAG: serine/threonine protein kinase [Labilithrix sp.]|nr:serine/threonine protein kinase [Labilithrix sp.]MCW5813791.1 serine/threonine protein kinase [Labilithrix sp.]